MALPRLAESSAGGARDPGPAVVLPEGWMISPIAVERLRRQLQRAPADVDAVVAPVVELVPGASFRVAAERAVISAWDTDVSVSTSLFGAVVARPGVEVEILDDRVVIPDAVVIVDPGAAVHDPWRVPLDVLPALSLARSPFPCRPVALFLGLEDDPYLADWTRRMVNELVEHQTEARIAVPAPTAGLHLTRPCA